MQSLGVLGTHLHSAVSKCEPSTQRTFSTQLGFAVDVTASSVSAVFVEFPGSGAPPHAEKSATENNRPAQIGFVFMQFSSLGVVRDAQPDC
jgi:hypothetical protein